MYKKYRTLDDFDFYGKLVLVRADLNSEISGGKVEMNDRIIESAKTIKEIQNKGGRVVVLAHQSRPGKKDFRNLKEHAFLLGKYIRIKFVPEVIGTKARKEIDNLKEGEALLLDNVRAVKAEFDNKSDSKLVKFFSKFDIYINDAFSVCHRSQSSVVAIPKKIRKRGIGRLVERELKGLSKISLKDSLFILGGAKPEENSLLLGNKNVLTCGIFGQLCLIASGKNLGAQNKFLEKDMKIIPELGRKMGRAQVPSDLAVKINGKRKELKIEKFPSKYEVYDIGPRTAKRYVKEIKSAKSIFMKGTAGFCEEKQFCKGTKKLLKAIEKAKGFSVLSGGHTSNAVKKLRINKKKLGFLSLSGGATVHYVLGNELPGLKILEVKK